MRIPFFALALGLLMALSFSSSAQAASGLPPEVIKVVGHGMAPVGSGTYRKFGFSVYHATLWAPNGQFDATKPYALQITYTRSVSQDTMIDTVMDDIRSQNVADDATLADWEKTLTSAMPDVDEGDTLIGVAIPGKKSLLFFNGNVSGSISDQTFSKAFFNIWLGDNADANLRNKLLGVAG